MEKLEKVKVAFALTAVVLVLAIVVALVYTEVRNSKEAIDREADNILAEYGIEKKKPSGKYASIADVYYDAVAWTDRYEKGDVSAEELRKAFSDLRIETTAFDDASAVNLRVAMSDLSSATWKDRKSIYNAIDALRRLKIE